MVTPITISAPGSLMLLGEHAVLHGHPCLVAAIDRRIRISAVPRNDGLVNVVSDLGEYEADRNDLPDHPKFRFILGALRRLPDAAPGGLDLLVKADMPPTIGFGTSAAVTAAMIGALQMIARGAWSMPDILQQTHEAILAVQGRGSGADAAASVYGGVVYYRMCKTGVEVINGEANPLTALYCGYKIPTADVIARVDQAWRGRPKDLERLYIRITDAVEAGRRALAARNHLAFGHALNEGQALMRELGVSTPELEACIERLLHEPGISGAKISGSGLGDCAIGWGATRPGLAGSDTYELVTSPGGIRLE